MKWIKTILLMCSICLVLMLVGFGYLYSRIEGRAVISTNAITTPTRKKINSAVARLIVEGRSSEVYAFYAQEVGDPLKASLYVESAFEAHVPIDMIMACGWYEGGHQIAMVDGPNVNGSFDVRPMGLNTYTYKMYSLGELEQMEFNIPMGAQHMADAQKKFQSTWETAMAIYNHGSPTGLDQRQIDYVVAVIRHEWELDRRFAVRFPDAIQ